MGLFIADVSLGPKDSPWLEIESMTAEDHGFISIVGPRGAGKTTLLAMIAGVYKPNHGEVRLTHDVKSSDALVVSYVTEGQVAAGLPLEVWYQSWRRNSHGSFAQQTSRIRKDLGLTEDDLKSPYHALRPDQWSLAAIGGALMACPDILLLDEPYTVLDDVQIRRLNHSLEILAEKSLIIVVSRQASPVSGQSKMWRLSGGHLKVEKEK